LWLSSSLPLQYYLISWFSVSKSLKTWMPRPLFKWVGFSNHKLNPSKWHLGIESREYFYFSKLNAYTFDLFLESFFSWLVMSTVSSRYSAF
jgi:hypothetical protein